MHSKPCIILLSAAGNLSHALRFATGEPLVIALDEEALRVAQMRGLESRFAGDYTMPPDEELWESVDALSREWYCINGHDYSEYDGLSLGELVYFDIGYRLLYQPGRKVALIQEIMQVHNPNCVVVSTDQNKQLATMTRACLPQTVQLHTVAPRWDKWLRLNCSAYHLKQWMRSQGVDYQARGAMFCLLDALRLMPRRRPDARLPKTLFIMDIPVTSIMDTLIPVIRQTPEEERLVLATDPRCMKLLSDRGIASVALWPPSLGVTVRILRSLKQELRARWEALDEEARTGRHGIFFRGVDLWPACRDEFRALFLSRFPIAVAHFRLACETIRRYRVRVVVTASDAHYVGQLFVHAAKRQGRRSLSVQHGMIVRRSFSYLPVRATKMAVWGEAARDWCLQNGARPEQIVVTGQPRFDALQKPPPVAREEIAARLQLSPDKPIWLLAPEPVTVTQQLGRWMRAIMFEALEQLPDVQVILRAHPMDAEAEHRAVVQSRPELVPRVRISRWPDVPSVLHACDLVVLGQSTLGLEAILVDKPVIVLLPDGVAEGVPYAQEGSALYANNSAELVQAWQQLSDPQTRQAQAQSRRRFVERYACRADGRNTERVIEVIKQLEKGAEECHD